MRASTKTRMGRLAVTALGLFTLTAFAAGTATATQTSFSNTNPITAPATGDVGVATPYPSPIPVTGLTGTVTKVTVTLHNLSHTLATQDLDVLLVAPDGKTVILMSDAGGVNPATNVTLTFDDAATDVLTNSALTSGTFRPTNLADNDPAGPDTFNAPAPLGPYGATLAALNGGNPNGTWQLFVLDDASDPPGPPGVGTIAGGWTLTITTRTSFIVTGAGAGGGPHVKIFTLDSAGNASPLGGGFFAYGSAFTGGVSVAVAEVGNDVHIITAAGAGGGPHVRIFKLNTATGGVTEVGGGFFAYDSAFTGGVRVAVGDVDGDGVPEIITSPGAGGGPHVRAFKIDYTTGAVTPLGGGFFAYDSSFTGGVFAAGGDF